MNKEDIISLPNVNLRERSKKIHVITPEARKLADDMIQASIDWENSRPHEITAALAAVQVDRLERIVVVRADFEDKDNKEFVALYNPEVVKYEGKVIYDYEGCLSVKNIYGKVPRHDKIRVKAMNADGEEVRLKADGFLARVLQHEIDHLNGTLFIDHIKDQKEAFYTLNEDGDLDKLDYAKEIENNSILWDWGL